MKRWQEILPPHLQVIIRGVLQCLHRCLAESGHTIQPGDIFVDLERVGTTSENACWASRLVIDQGGVTHLHNPRVTFDHHESIVFQEAGLQEFLQGRQRMLIGIFPGTEGLLPPNLIPAFKKLSESLGTRGTIVVGNSWHKLL